MNKPAPTAESERRRVSQRLRELLDTYASSKGYARFIEMPADVLDVNEADRAIGGPLHHYVLHPLAYAKGYVEKRPGTPDAKEITVALQAGRESRRKLERHLRRFLQSALAAWQDDVLPTLLDAQAIAREEHREDEPIGPTLDRLAADGRLRMPSSWHLYELGRAIGLKDFAVTPTTGPWPATQLKAGRAELRPAGTANTEWATWQPTALAAALEKMNLRVESLGQRTRDIYYIMLAKWAAHQTHNLPGGPWISVDEILELLGSTKKLDASGARYGYIDRDRWMVRQAIEALADIHVSLKIPQPGKRKVTLYDGYFLTLGDRRGQAGLSPDIRGASVAAFTHIEYFLPALARQGIDPHAAPYLYLHIKALQYTGKQALEKSIAYYLAQMARINVSPTVRAKVATLLTQAGMGELDPRKAGAIRKRTHKALNTLADDGLTAEWKYTDPDWEQALRKAQDAGRRPRGWAEEWLQQNIEFALPQEPDYRSIAARRQERLQHKTPKPRPAPPPAEVFTLSNTDATPLARQVAAAIHHLKLTRAEAAGAIGISRPTLAALMDGKPTRDAVRQRASAWLHTTKGHTDA